MIKKFILASVLVVSASFAFAQDKGAEDESKMIREVISVQVDKSAFAVKSVPAAPIKGKKTSPPPEAAPDTSNPMIAAPVSEIANRAKNWSVAKSTGNKYTKSNCVANGDKATCNASFVYKTKELNPTEKIDGEITMTITVDSKEGKYRYTINNIKHKATDATSSGGDVYLQVPECGSMKISSVTWKHIKSGALADARLVADELKAFMNKLSSETAQKSEW